ncbi:MAG: hypothetical protein J5494_01595 [Candidatus Methanomethylophilaceae archaeon]|nr:hypothetical protein [Candidatus Methanomethylophilaceae archaeon]
MASITLNGSGKVFPGGSSTLTWSDSADFPLPSPFVLPDGFIMNCTDAHLTGWSDGDTTKRPGEIVSSGTWTAQYVPDLWNYSDGVAIAVRIWRTWSVFTDVTMMLDPDGGLPIITMAENNPGSCRFVMGMDWSVPADNPLDASYNHWQVISGAPGTASPGKIGLGMFVTTYYKTSGGTRTPYWQGRISTLEPDDGRLRIECGDLIAFLGRSGTTCRRNLYSARTIYTGDASYSGSTLSGSLSAMPSGSVLDLQSLTWGVVHEVDRDDVARFRGTNLVVPWGEEDESEANDLLLKWRIPISDAITLRSVYVGIQADDAGSYMIVTVHQNGAQLSTSTVNLVQDINPRWYTVPAVADLEPGEVEIRLWTLKNKSYRIPMGDDMIGSQSYFALSGLAPEWDSQIPAWGWTYYRYEMAEGTQSGTTVIMTKIGEYTDMTDPDLRNPPENRLRFAGYASTLNALQAIRQVCYNAGILCTVPEANISGSETVVGMFRIGGGYTLDYLKQLVRIPSSETGALRSVVVTGMTVPFLSTGSRYDLGGTPYRKFTWMPRTGYTEFVEFKPKMTLKNRPTLAVIKGMQEVPGSDPVPLMAVAEDVDMADYLGVSVETIQTSGSMSLPSAYGEALRQITDAGALEGTLAIPRDPSLFSIWTYRHGGVSRLLSVTDPRYGLADEPVIATQTVTDYNAETTTLTLTALPDTCSSTIPNAVAAVQSAGDLASITGDLWNLQFVRAIGMWSLRASGTSTLEVSADGSTWWPCENVAVVKMPERAVLTGVIKGTPAHNTEGEKYAIKKIRANGTVMDVPYYRRPDLYIGQTLIVVADCLRV